MFYTQKKLFRLAHTGDAGQPWVSNQCGVDWVFPITPQKPTVHMLEPTTFQRQQAVLCIEVDQIIVLCKFTFTAFSTEYILWEHDTCERSLALPSSLHVAQVAHITSHIPHHTKVYQGMIPGALLALISCTVVDSIPQVFCSIDTKSYWG